MNKMRIIIQNDNSLKCIFLNENGIPYFNNNQNKNCMISKNIMLELEKKPSTVKLFEEDFKKVEAIANKNGVTFSDIIRFGVHQQIELMMKLLKKDKNSEKNSMKDTQCSIRFFKKDMENANLIEEEFGISFTDIVRFGMNQFLENKFAEKNNEKQEFFDFKLQQK